MSNSVPTAPAATHPQPVLKVTFYDRLSSFMMAIVLGLLVAVVFVIPALHGMPSLVQPPPRPVGSLAPGGFEDGTPDETLRVDSPEDPIPNASAVDGELADEPIEETIETVMELADAATGHIQQMRTSDFVVDGTPGSTGGTDGPPLGEDPTPHGPPSEQRWFIQFPDRDSVDEYARQLDYFGIELGVLFPDRGELTCLSDMSDANPSTRTVTSAEDEQRLYMNWEGGSRRAADAELYERAGIDISGGIVLHFYPRRTEELLARLEQSYANRPVRQIRRTYFVVVEQGSAYTFAVTRQRYLRASGPLGSATAE